MPLCEWFCTTSELRCMAGALAFVNVARSSPDKSSLRTLRIGLCGFTLLQSLMYAIRRQTNERSDAFFRDRLVQFIQCMLIRIELIVPDCGVAQRIDDFEYPLAGITLVDFNLHCVAVSR